MLAPPAERQFPHWHLTPRGHVSLKMAFCSDKLPNPFGYREQALLGAFFFVQASLSGKNYASAGWMGGREKAQGPRATLPRSLKTPWPAFVSSFRIFPNWLGYAEGFCFFFFIVKGKKEEGGHSIMARTGNFYFDIFLHHFSRK